jgi:hypothetical protein
MTKIQAISEFRELYRDVIRLMENDTIARRTMWNDYTDTLCKMKQITMRQYETWTNPF